MNYTRFGNTKADISIMTAAEFQDCQNRPAFCRVESECGACEEKCMQNIKIREQLWECALNLKS